MTGAVGWGSLFEDANAGFMKRPAADCRVTRTMRLASVLTLGLSLFSAFPSLGAEEWTRGIDLFRAGRHAEARPFLEEGVRRREPAAFAPLGLMYEKGLGGRQDFAKARFLYFSGHLKRDPVATSNLGFLHLYGRGVPRNFQKARKYFWEGADLGSGAGFYGLAILYRDGLGVERNPYDAVIFFARASHLGLDGDQMWTYIQPLLPELRRYRVTGSTVNARTRPNTESDVLLSLRRGAEVFHLILENGWRYVYISERNTLAFIYDGLLQPASGVGLRQPQTGPFPERPAAKPGLVTCNTFCRNGDCFRTYDDGRQVRFQVAPRFDPFTNQMRWDPGPC